MHGETIKVKKKNKIIY